MLSHKLTYKAFLPWLWSGLACLCLAGCDVKTPSALEKIKQEGVLHVATRNSPVTYFEDRNGETGFEYELSRRFAKKLGVKLQVTTVNNLDALYDKVTNSDKPLIAAGGLIETAQRSQQVAFSNPYLTVDTFVVYRNGLSRPSSTKDLIGKSILVIEGSSQANKLEDLKKKWPELAYQESDSVDIIDLLQMIEDKKIDIALVNSNELAMTQVYYPNVRVGFTLATQQEVSWAIAKSDEDESLQEAINEFFAESKVDGSLDRLTDRFYGHIDVLGYVGAFTFAKHLQDRLPKYENYFIRYGKEFKFDWQLLAAIGYQESHWNPEAVSPTGVRGLMMLTQSTAKAMGVANRLDAQQSIMGGAKLLSILKQSVDKDIEDPDRTFFSLAAYNMGQGHVTDAQKLAEMQSLNSKQWRDVNQILPLLAQKQWHQKTKYGYARGFETKQFVRNVRRYYDILTWLNHSQRETPANINKTLHIPAISKNELTNPITQSM